jgi:hypothetical protein
MWMYIDDETLNTAIALSFLEPRRRAPGSGKLAGTLVQVFSAEILVEVIRLLLTSSNCASHAIDPSSRNKTSVAVGHYTLLLGVFRACIHFNEEPLTLPKAGASNNVSSRIREEALTSKSHFSSSSCSIGLPVEANIAAIPRHWVRE